MSEKIISFIRGVYKTDGFIPLHAPQFLGTEREYVLGAIDSTFVSSVGEYVDKFELELARYTGSEKVVATVNGTAALHAALHLAGVRENDLVITQALTFVATCNAVRQTGADVVFVDVSANGMGLCPIALEQFLHTNAYLDDCGECRHSGTGRRIKSIIPMHTFGHPAQLDELEAICNNWKLVLVEDAAESLGSLYKGSHAGTIGRFGALSFNGNKIITTGGGGAILCRNSKDGAEAKYVTTTAKVPHPYEYFHDQVGFNYRMPNLNAALGCAQMQVLGKYVEQKRALANKYREYFGGEPEYMFVEEPSYAKSNFWLNAVLCKNHSSRGQLLEELNRNGVMARPVWALMHRLPMYSSCIRGDLSLSEELEQRLVNLPSTPVVCG